MKILLVNPGKLDDQGRHFRMAREIVYGLTLPLIAALIPPPHEVKIVDDCVEPLDYDAPVDAVLLTAMTCRAERAYQIADEFRARGRKVVMGGIHATMFPEAARAHVDAVAVGEAETIMPELLDDLAAGRLQDFYRADHFHDLKGLPPPRYDLMNRSNYVVRWNPVQLVRGCPNHCRYCTVSLMYGAQYRLRPVGDVLDDLAAADRILHFVDDNFFANRDYALELMREMKKRRLDKLFEAQANLNLAEDEELLRAAREAGMFMLYTGIETLDRSALRSMNKSVNLGLDVGAALDRLRRSGVSVLASMMIGFDSDTRESAESIIAFLEAHKTPALFLYIFTPPPGSSLWREYEEAGRLIPSPWRNFDGMHVVFQPQNFSAEELEELYWRMLIRFYSPRGIFRRLAFPPYATGMILNYIIYRKLKKYRLHPWSGVPGKRGLSALEPLLDWMVRSNWPRKLALKLER